MADRLNHLNASDLPSDVGRSPYERSRLKRKMVHIGVGAFHRAHQALYTEEANAHTDEPWGVTGISLRSSTAFDQLSPQDGLYTVGVSYDDRTDYQLVTNLLEVVTAPETPLTAMTALSNPDVQVVTLTITEKGYAVNLSTGDLLLDDRDLADDLRCKTPPKSALGILFAACAERRRTNAGPLTLLSCDNIPSNGTLLAGALRQFAEHRDPSMVAWIDDNVCCPCSMVDRIVPAVSETDRQSIAEAFGLRDEGFVRTEPFSQWVIQDQFAGDRPPWETAGAMIVPQVEAFESMKLRLLNGSHSAIAYLGLLGGFSFVHEVVSDTDMAEFVERLMDDEVLPTLTPPDGFDLKSYTAELRGRFENKNLAHSVSQIAQDGSAKLSQRIITSLAQRVQSNAASPLLLLVIAAWVAFVAEAVSGERNFILVDPQSDMLHSAAKKHGRNHLELLKELLWAQKMLGDLTFLTGDTMHDISQMVGVLRHEGLKPALRLALRDGFVSRPA